MIIYNLHCQLNLLKPSYLFVYYKIILTVFLVENRYKYEYIIQIFIGFEYLCKLKNGVRKMSAQ